MGRVFLLLLLLDSLFCGAQSSHTLDLKPYGFQPTRNTDYEPQEFTAMLQYFPDGSIAVAFRTRALVSGKIPRALRTLQPTELLRIDAHSGKLLAQTRLFVRRNFPFLSASPTGVLAVEADTLVNYSPELIADRRLVPPPESVVAVVPEQNAILFYQNQPDGDEKATVIDLTTQEPRAVLTVPPGARIAAFDDGYAMVAHDTHDRRIVRIVRGSKTMQIPLPMLPCRTSLHAISRTQGMAVTCQQWFVFDQDGQVVVKGHFGTDEDEPYVAGDNGRFAVSTYVGFAGFPRDQQRRLARAIRITVFDLEKKAKIFSRDLSPPPKLGGTFALRADGKQLAILKDGELELADLP